MKPQSAPTGVKAQVGLEAVRGLKTISEIVQVYGAHPQWSGRWKLEILESAGAMFETRRCATLQAMGFRFRDFKRIAR